MHGNIKKLQYSLNGTAKSLTADTLISFQGIYGHITQMSAKA